MALQSFKGHCREYGQCSAMKEGAQAHCLPAQCVPIPGRNRLFPDKGWTGKTTPYPWASLAGLLECSMFWQRVGGDGRKGEGGHEWEEGQQVGSWTTSFAMVCLIRWVFTSMGRNSFANKRLTAEWSYGKPWAITILATQCKTRQGGKKDHVSGLNTPEWCQYVILMSPQSSVNSPCYHHLASLRGLGWSTSLETLIRG